MHKVANIIEAAVSIPLLYIADPTGQEIRRNSIDTVGLIGTRFTMKQEFYRDRLTQHHGINVIVPNASDREIVHKAIYDELCLGKIYDQSRMSIVA